MRLIGLTLRGFPIQVVSQSITCLSVLLVSGLGNVLPWRFSFIVVIVVPILLHKKKVSARRIHVTSLVMHAMGNIASGINGTNLCRAVINTMLGW